MQLTKQIIDEVVQKSIKAEFIPLKQRLNEMDSKIDTLGEKIDKLTDIVTDFAGSVKKFDEEQTVLSGQMINRTDRIEKLEIGMFGQVAIV